MCFGLDARKKFKEKVKIDAESGCWVWTGSRHPKGYGHFSLYGRKFYSHRYIMEFLYGPIPVDMELHHKCGRRECVNPQHLEIVTHAENMKEAVRKRMWCGENNPNAKLKDKDVRIIKTLSKKGIPIRELAEMFGLPLRSAYYAVRGWKHLSALLKTVETVNADISYG